LEGILEGITVFSEFPEKPKKIRLLTGNKDSYIKSSRIPFYRDFSKRAAGYPRQERLPFQFSFSPIKKGRENNIHLLYNAFLALLITKKQKTPKLKCLSA